MSIISKTKCNCCHKETSDFYSEKGWIKLCGIQGIVISKGRRSDQSAITDWKNTKQFSDIDFCCPACLLSFVEQPTESSLCPFCDENHGPCLPR